MKQELGSQTGFLRVPLGDFFLFFMLIIRISESLMIKRSGVITKPAILCKVRFRQMNANVHQYECYTDGGAFKQVVKLHNCPTNHHHLSQIFMSSQSDWECTHLDTLICNQGRVYIPLLNQKLCSSSSESSGLGKKVFRVSVFKCLKMCINMNATLMTVL